MAKPASAGGAVRVGIGGWTYAPWRGLFYPEKLPAKRELEHASRQLTAIEINGTFYRSQGPKSFAKWRAETPDDFVFAVKGHRAVVNAKKLGEAGDAIDWFFQSGVTELGPKLGPILWQLAPFKKFDPEDLGAFLARLPKEADGLPLRHALEVRNKSFLVPAFPALAAEHGVAIVYADSDEHPAIADLTADFVYLRLQRSRADLVAGYPDAELDRWAERARLWAEGGEPDGLEKIGGARPEKRKRDVFVFFIASAKERNPAAATALIARLKG
jgi:uncharacterized protein YecE (DUF72 family)